MDEKCLNIISFNIPYPADYGGVIDVFYKLKSLAENNIKIILHTFEYGRKHAPELEKYCDQVYYYKRKTGFLSQLSVLPYIIYSRRDKALLTNLQKNDYPILFEGLHTCYYINHPSLKNRLKLVRAHNIEHLYYAGIAANTHSFLDKCYFHLETFRLKKQEKRFNFADYILPLSSAECRYFEMVYGKEKTQYIPPFFHFSDTITLPQTTKPYVLYHGDLSTPENIYAATFLIRSIASRDENIRWIFAGKNPDDSLLKLAEKYDNVSVQANLEEGALLQLIHEARVNLLYTGQVSGVKLKLLNALHNGYYCLANKKMVEGSGLETLCEIISDNPEEILTSVRKCFQEDLPKDEAIKREKLLGQLYDNNKNALIIKNLLSHSLFSASVGFLVADLKL
jgi:DNA-binding Xre family transcriptional regulator